MGYFVGKGTVSYLCHNRCVARVCCKSVDHWLTAAHAYSNSTQITDGCAIGQLLCFRCMQAVTADTVIAYITHEEYLAKPMRACFCRFVWARYVVWPLLYGLHIASCDRRLDERYEVIDLTFAAYQPTDSRSRKTHFLNYLDSC